MSGYVIVATRARDRWFDLDAVRTPAQVQMGRNVAGNNTKGSDDQSFRFAERVDSNPAGAPPLDWFMDDGTDPTFEGERMTAELRIGDVFAQVARLEAEIAAGEADPVDLAVSSPPFLALRSYLPADHPDKQFEIGSEATPAAFLDTLLRLVAALDGVLAPHGSLVFELGDTYSGSGGAGGDYGEGGLRDGQPKFRSNRKDEGPDAWPLAKSLCGIPTLFAWSLAYGRNLLTSEPSPAGQWRIRNVIPWARPNPPVGALGDKWRPATSYVTVACRARDRWFDLDAVRTAGRGEPRPAVKPVPSTGRAGYGTGAYTAEMAAVGAPPLDWYHDPAAEHQADDGLWIIPTQPYGGSHYATFPRELVRRLIECMCPREVCRQCGTPRRRIVDVEYEPHGERVEENKGVRGGAGANGEHAQHMAHGRASLISTTLGWTDCGCLCYSCGNGGCPECTHKYRPGIVLDPFAGSGTTLEVASGLGRDSIGFDLDARNADLAMDRVGPLLLTVDYGEAVA